MSTIDIALARCEFPPTGTSVDLAISGGADSVGLALLASYAGLNAHLHYVDHHLRAGSGRDGELVRALADFLGFTVSVHEVDVAPGGNLEARARAARRAVLPERTMTGHTMDDLAETVILNMLRGAGLDGLSPMVGDPTKPILALRRAEVLELVRAAERPYVIDETNADVTWLRNRVRHETLPTLNRTASRDLVPLLARQANLIYEERQWLDRLSEQDAARPLQELDCRELRQWPLARLRRWLRVRLRGHDDEAHPPSADEIERVIAVVRGEIVATEITGGRRVARHEQHLRLE